MDSSKSTPTYRINKKMQRKEAMKVLPTMSPLKDGIIGIGNVKVLLKVNAISEYRSRLEVLFYLLDKLLKY
jgi:hypothetical protein